MDEKALKDAAFLATSANRPRALEVLSQKPHSRSELETRIGVSRMTAKRILDDFRARGWIDEQGSYRTTALGDVVIAEFNSLLEILDTVQKLAAIFHWLPDDFDIDPRKLVDSRVTVNSWSDSVAPVRRAAEIAHNARTLRVAGSGIAPDVIKAIRDAAVAGGDVTFVTTEQALEVLRASEELSEWMIEAMDAGADLYRHPGFMYLIAQCDDVAVIGVNDEAGVPRGLVESRNPRVCEWVTSTVDRCHSEGEAINIEELSSM